MVKKTNPYTGEIEKAYDMSYAGVMIAQFGYMSGLTPVKWTYRKDSPGEAEAKRVSATAATPTGRFSHNGVTYKLTNTGNDTELEEYKEYRAKYINEYLNKLINSSGYERLSDTQKAEAIKKVYSRGSEYAKTQWIKNNTKATKEKYKI